MISQFPVAHECVAVLLSEQATLQPQQSVSVFVEVSQPLSGSPSQLSKPLAQFGTQAPPLHDVLPLLLVHVLPQLPQFVGDVSEFTSHPSPS